MSIPHLCSMKSSVSKVRGLTMTPQTQHALARDYAAGALGGQAAPCLSLYQPTHRHHPENQQDVIRFGNLVKELEHSLLQAHSAADTRTLLEPLRAVESDAALWNHTADGLAVLVAKGFFRVYTLPRTVRALAVVADSFHTKPLARLLQTVDRYQVLGLNLHEVKLFEGNRDALDQVELAPGVPRTMPEALGFELTEPHQTVASYDGVGGGTTAMRHGHGGMADEVDTDAVRFFRTVDRAILEHHSRPTKLPLMLASLPEHHAPFRKVSHNPFLSAEALDIHPDAISHSALVERAWKLAQPQYANRIKAMADKFREAVSKDHGTGALDAAAIAATSGRVATLMVEADRQIPGRLDAATGAVTPADLSQPEVDDLLDDLAALTLEQGGEVLVVPKEHMPTDTGVAAVFRY